MVNNTQGNSGLTQKEMLLMVLEGQEKINERIDSLHEKGIFGRTKSIEV